MTFELTEKEAYSYKKKHKWLKKQGEDKTLLKDSFWMNVKISWRIVLVFEHRSLSYGDLQHGKIITVGSNQTCIEKKGTSKWRWTGGGGGDWRCNEYMEDIDNMKTSTHRFRENMKVMYNMQASRYRLTHHRLDKK